MSELREWDAPGEKDRAKAATTPGEHYWWLFSGLPCCAHCGIVRRRDGKNSPCRGKVRIDLRASASRSADMGTKAPRQAEAVCEQKQSPSEPSQSKNIKD